MAALKCLSVVHSVSTFLAVLLCPIALAQSTASTPHSLVKLNVLVTDKVEPLMRSNSPSILPNNRIQRSACSQVDRPTQRLGPRPRRTLGGHRQTCVILVRDGVYIQCEDMRFC